MTQSPKLSRARAGPVFQLSQLSQLLLLALLALLASCVEYQAQLPPGPRLSSGPLLSGQISQLTAPFQGRGNLELYELAGQGMKPSALLRRAYILMETRRAKAAIRAVNRVLYGLGTLSPATESNALYLRSRAFALSGDESRAVEDCQKALRLALDRELRRRLEEDLARYQPKPKQAAPKLGPVAAPPTILPRQAWRPRRIRRRGMSAMRRVTRLTIHHSAILMPRKATRARVATAIQSIQRYHQGPKGWEDIGYHYLVDSAGRVWTGRALRYQGAHAGGVRNVGNIGVCLLGKFTRNGGQAVTPPQRQALRRLVAYLALRFGLGRSQIHTHRELNGSTICPGLRLQAVVDELRRDPFLASAGPTLQPPLGSGK